MTSAGPVLVLPSHGTGDPSGQRAIRALVDAVTERVDAPVLDCFVDVQQPDVPTTLTTAPGTAPLVIVPLLLSTGYHVRVDIAEAALSVAPRPTAVAPALGPDDRLVDLLALRLREAGSDDTDHVVLAAAGSSDPDAVADCATVAAALGDRLKAEVTVGFLASAEPRLDEAISAARDAHPESRVAVATYLLAPGYFARLAAVADADLVTAPLLRADEAPPAGLVDLVIDRYTQAVQTLAVPA
ncbi:cobalamin biosynthesis protein CbiX [Diaminobutyricibacter tongyongensis]|uniref:Cobalamin biosynthesis protein CbiX n=1 Tax=Leifsonia tongyongensis TaxID=1268043 RepID=A0A6L9XT36_9MICO|nr:CbiX/SirB N-terminal domain-containing protein [Diaminobutyricibacter tongyongensis]NEN04571.1 cobalamin biosynthesis protein CbiX [Diaminobutyricibacter tongyongensis]